MEEVIKGRYFVAAWGDVVDQNDVAIGCDALRRRRSCRHLLERFGDGQQHFSDDVVPRVSIETQHDEMKR